MFGKSPELEQESELVTQLIVAERGLRQRRAGSSGTAHQGTAGSLDSRQDPPARIGRYEIHERIGAGSFGTVYKARDTELDRSVAVKVLRDRGPAAHEEMNRFLREARSSAQLKHPNIISIHDAGRVDDLCFIVSEFVAGETLAARIARGKLPFRQSAELLAQIADALDYAHRQGVIHRDLKPANVLLQEDKGSGMKDVGGASTRESSPIRYLSSLIPKITDFGLAKRETGECTLTMHGAVLGTPAYMAPEQARGDSHQVEARSDIYSAGVILYELLTGELPFRGNSRMVLRQVLEDEPRGPRRLNDEIPRDLENICRKAMTKEPGGRYHSAADLADDLRRFLRGEPVHARPVGAASKLWRWCRRRPTQAVLAASVVLMGLIGFSGITWQCWRAEQHRRHAEEQRLRAEESFTQAHRAVNDLVGLSTTNAIKDEAWQPIRRELLEKALRYYQDFVRTHSDDPAIRFELADAYTRLASLSSEMYDKHAAIAGRLKAFEIWMDLLREEPTSRTIHVRVAYTLLALANLHRQTQRYPEALRYFEQTQRAAEQLIRQEPTIGSHRQLQAQCLRGKANVHFATGQSADALALYHTAREILEQVNRDRPAVFAFQLDSARVLVETGTCLLALEQKPEGIASFQQAIVLWDQVIASEPNSVRHQHELATIYRKLVKLLDDDENRLDAFRVADRANELLQQLLRQKPTDQKSRVMIAQSYLSISSMLEASDRLDDAVHFCKRAIEIREELVREKPKDIAFRKALIGAYSTLGNLERARDQFAAAMQAHRAAVRIGDEIERENPGQQLSSPPVRSIYWLARAEAEAGYPAEAVNTYRRAAAEYERLASRAPSAEKHQSGLAASYHNIGRLEVELGQPNEAVASYRTAIELRERLARENPDKLLHLSDLAGTIYRLGEALHLLGRLEEAAATYQQAAAKQKEVLAREPDSSKYREALSESYRALSRLLSESGKSAEAAAFAPDDGNL